MRRFEAKMAAVLNDQWRGCSWEVAEFGARRRRRRSREHHAVCVHGSHIGVRGARRGVYMYM